MEVGVAFEIASKDAIRYPSSKGRLSTEDLWNLRLEDLDSIYKALNKKAKDSQEESLLGPSTKENRELTVQLTIVRYIANVKLNDIERHKHAVEKRALCDQIEQALADKEKESLTKKSPEELRKMLSELRK